MTDLNLLQAMGRIDPKLIAEAAPDIPRRKNTNRMWLKWGAVAACLVFLISSILTLGYATGIFDEHNPNIWLEDAKNGGIDDRLTEQITVGMTLGEVVEIIGKPQRDTGSGAVVMEWDMKSGRVFVVCFNPDAHYDLDPASQPTGKWVSYYIEIRDKENKN